VKTGENSLAAAKVSERLTKAKVAL